MLDRLISCDVTEEPVYPSLPYFLVAMSLLLARLKVYEQALQEQELLHLDGHSLLREGVASSPTPRRSRTDPMHDRWTAFARAFC